VSAALLGNEAEQGRGRNHVREYNKLRLGDQSASGGVGAALVERLRENGCAMSDL